MSARPPARTPPKASPDDDLVVDPKPRRGSLRWVREVLGRSIRLELPRQGAPAASVASRLGAASSALLSLLGEQRAELGARLLVHDPATQAVRSLFVVHDELREGGWRRVDALPHVIVAKALAEAQVLQNEEASPLLQTIIDSLRKIVAAAEARAAEEAVQREWATPAGPEVSETDYDEYELMERSWVGTVPNGLDLSVQPPPTR